jgi:hypothetical protein
MHLIISAIIIAIVVIIAAWIITAPRGNPPPPPPIDVEMDALSARWEQLSIIDARPSTGSLYLWLTVKVTNGLDEDLLIFPTSFGVEGTNGVQRNATDDDSPGMIAPNKDATFNLSVEAPASWIPKSVHYSCYNEVFTDTVPSPTAMVPDIAFNNISVSRSSTDSAGLSHSPQEVLNITFDMKNQWTKSIDTYATLFNVVNATGGSVSVYIETGPDAVSAGATGHFRLEFLVSTSFDPSTLKYDMGDFGPYGSTSV